MSALEIPPSAFSSKFKMTYLRDKKIWKATKDSAEFYCYKKGNVLLIDFAWSWERGKGHAGALLTDLLAWAKKRVMKVESTHPINPMWETLCKRFGLTVHYNPSNAEQPRVMWAVTIVHRPTHKRYNRIGATAFSRKQEVNVGSWTFMLAELKKSSIEAFPNRGLTPENTDLIVHILEPVPERRM